MEALHEIDRIPGWVGEVRPVGERRATCGRQGRKGLEFHPNPMALNIKDEETVRLAAEVAELAGESKTAAVREALKLRKDRLELESGGTGRSRRAEDLLRFLETQIWPQIPEELRGGPPMTKAEKEELLGYGPGGV